MAVFVLPAAAAGRANHNFKVELDGAEYDFRMRFNSRDQGWYFSIFDGDGAAIVEGLKIVINADLTLRATQDNAFGGRVYVLDGRRFTANPTLDNLGVDLPMVYDDAGVG
jgi:hypothetical protein